MPHMRFVFLGPEVRLQLPSDTPSRGLPLLFGLEFPSSRPPEDSHLLVTSRFGFPYRFPSYVHHARRFAPCPAHVAQASRLQNDRKIQISRFLQEAELITPQVLASPACGELSAR